MKTKITLLLMLFVAITLKAQVEPTDTDGDGSRNISTLAHLQWVSENSSCWGDNLELDNDIDASGTSKWNSGAGFSPIGNSSTKYTGVFDGNNHVISGLYIDKSTDYAALFGYTDTGCEIKNLGVEGADISGYRYTSAIAGYFRYSKITNCYATGDVYSSGDYVGGVVAYNYYSATVSCYSEVAVEGDDYYIGSLVGYNYYGSVNDCYATGDVDGYYYTGGLVGRNYYGSIANSYCTGDVTSTSNYTGGLTGYNYYGSVSNSYCTGAVSGAGYTGGLTGYCSSGSVTYSYSTGTVKGTSNVGGLIGYNSSGTYTGSFWDKTTSGYTTSAGGTGKTTSEMKTKSTYTNAGWNFDFIWDMASNYPFIDIDYSYRPKDTDNDGYLNITAISDFRWFTDSGFDLDANIELSNDIDASATKTWNGGAGFAPLGSNGSPYLGTFEGHDYTISNLYINRSTELYIGFFGYLGGTAKNIILKDCSISGKQYVGGLAGRNDNNSYSGTIIDCSVSGTVTGASSYVGGIAGYNYYASISSCSATCDVSGSSSYVGGVAGYNSYGNVSNCSAMGDVSGKGSYVGGLIGYHYYSNVKNSYATGDVSNTSSYTGGFTGRNYYSDITNCYATGSVDGTSYVGGFAGYCYGSTTTPATITNSYSTGSVSGSSNVGGFNGYNSTGTYNNCFWDTNTSGYTTSAGGTGKTTTAMKTKSTYTGWNFNIIWDITTGYPFINIDPTDGPSDTDHDGSINISTLAHFEWLSETGYYANQDWELDNNIDATDTKNWNNGAGWNPIASYANVFDGNGYTIKNLYIDRISSNYVGFFGKLAGTVKNITFESCDITGYQYVACIAGRSDYATVSNCKVTGDIYGDYYYIAAVVGYSYYSDVNFSSADVDLYGDYYYTGGLVGYNYYSDVDFCSSIGTVEGYYYTGGLVGYNYYGTITNSYSTSDVTATSSYTGGLTGRNYYATISDSYAMGSVSGTSYVGGLTGYSYGSTTSPAIVTNSYSTGKVTGSSSIGGLIGYNSSTTYTSSYWDKTTSGQSSSAGGTGKTTAEMKTQSTYVDWNFTDLWAIDSKKNDGYPFIVTPIQTPGLATPSNTAKDIALLPTFVWSTVEDATSYNLVVMDDKGAAVIDVDVAGTTYTATVALVHGKRFTWKVNATDGDRVSKWSDIWSFTTKTINPPTLRTPATSAVEVSVVPAFTWTTSGGIEPTSYNIEVSTDMTFATTVISAEALNANYTPTKGLRFNTTYYWRVNGTNGVITGAWSKVFKFTTRDIPTPALSTPANMAMDVVTKPTLTWGAIPGATSFNVQVATDDMFTNIITDKVVNEATYTLETALAFNAGYYWRVNATDGYAVSKWSDVNQFTTEPLRAPALTTPANLATGVVVIPTFEWAEIVGAAGYNIEVATDLSFTTKVIDTDVIAPTYTPSTKVLSFGSTYYWRVNATDGLIITDWSTVSQFTTEPLLAPTLTAPADMAEFVLTNPTFTWEEVVGSNDYLIQVATDASFANIVTELTIATTSYTPATALELGTTYFWRLKARDGGSYSPWSEEREFRTEPIKVPVITYPMNLATEINMFTPFNWEDVATAVSYHIEVATDMAFTNKVIDTYVGTSEFTPNTPLVKETTYYWHVNANNGLENSLWTATHEFKTEPLYAPVLATPSNNLMDAVLRPEFDWNDVKDAVRYTIQISTDSFFNNDVLETVVTTSNYTPTNDLVESTTYFWRVIATDDIVLSQWSDVRTFTTEPIVPPLLYTPANNAKDLVLLPSFDWNDVKGATEYHIQISTTSDFSAIVAEMDVTASEYTATAELLEHTNYFWRVNATNGSDISRWSETRIFTTEPIVPPLLYTPEDNAMDLVLLPSFDWNDVVEATGYCIQISSTSDFSTIEIQADVMSSEYTATTELREHTNYFWRVNATNGTDVGRWSEVRNFTTEPIVPPLLGAPANNAVDVVFAPTFDWNDVVEATGYNIQISETADFATTVRDVDVTASTYTTTGSLVENTTYFWRVNATNGKDVGRWSETRTFLVEPIFPTNLVSPAANVTGLTVNPTFEWTAVQYAVGYRIEVSKTMDFAVRAVEAYVFGTTYTPSVNLAENTTYFWRVYATDGTNISRWSEVRTLKTEAIAPPYTSTPADMATDVSLTPTFNWGTVRSATSYNVEVSTDATFATKVIDADVNTTYYNATNILKGETTYYWRASATNGTDVSKWSEVKSFETKALDAPVLNTPADMTTNVEVLPTFTWAATTGATSYELEVSTDMAFATKVIDVDLTTTSYTATVTLDNYTTYYWRVNATDEVSVSPWSNANEFATSCEYAAPVDTDGNGYYNITNLCELRWVSEHSTLWASKFELDNDIDASFTQEWNSGAGFCPIGNATTAFTGEFDGHDNVIDGLYINRTTANVGFFGLNKGTIKNAVLENADITGDQYVGALVGRNEGSIITCATTGNIAGTYKVGGLVGENNNGTLKTSFSEAVIAGEKYSGGLVGNNYIATISNSYAVGAVTGTANVAGLAGGNYKATIEYSYATGAVTGTSVTGGLVGKNEQSTVTSAYWDTETTGITAAGAGIGMTTTEMKTESKFTGWDFDFTWTINTDNNGYPCFDISPVNTDITHSVTLSKGWNMVSTYVEANDNDLENMTSEIIDDVVLIKDQSGNIFYPAYDINFINTWTVEKGYLFYMKENTTLDVVGSAVEEGRVINLDYGWNMIAYLCDASQPIKTALADIKTNVLLVKNGAGQIYFPSANIDGIGNMNPGEGYMVYMNKNDALEYPVPTGGGLKVTPTGLQEIKFENPSCNNATVVVYVNMPNNTEVEAYGENNNLVGAGTVIDGRVVLTVYGDDEFTEAADGAKANENITFKALNPNTANWDLLELTDIKDIVSENTYNNVRYQTNSILQAKVANDVITLNTNTMTVVPNPANTNPQLSLNINTDSEITIEVFDAAGTLVQTVYNGQFINNTTINIDNMASGSYQVVVRTNDEVYTTIMVIEK